MSGPQPQNKITETVENAAPYKKLGLPKRQEVVDDPKSYWARARLNCHCNQKWGKLAAEANHTDVNARLTHCYALVEEAVAAETADEKGIISLIADLKKDENLRKDEYLLGVLERIEKRVETRSDPFPARLSQLPTDEWLEKKGLSKEELFHFIKRLQRGGADGAGLYLWEAKKGLQTIFESSAAWSTGNGKPLREMKSSAKSVAGLLFFIAATRGFLDLDQPVTEILKIPAPFDEKWKLVTSRHLLNQASGLRCMAPSDQGSDALERHLQSKFDANPEEQFRYSNAGSQLLGFILDAALEKLPSYTSVRERVSLFARRFLFHPLGIRDDEMQFTYHLKPHDGVPFTSYGIKATPFAFAQFSQIFLYPGETLAFDKKPVLAETDLGEILTPTSLRFPGIQQVAHCGDPKIYGNCFYLHNDGIDTRGECETDMCLVSRNDNVRDLDGRVNVQYLTNHPCLVCVRQQCDPGRKIADTFDLVKLIWKK